MIVVMVVKRQERNKVWYEVWYRDTECNMHFVSQHKSRAVANRSGENLANAWRCDFDDCVEP